MNEFEDLIDEAAGEAAEQIIDDLVVASEEAPKMFIVKMKLFENLHDKNHVTKEFLVKADSETDAKSSLAYTLATKTIISTTDDEVINLGKVSRFKIVAAYAAPE